MGFLIFPMLLILTVAPGPGGSEKALADFSRFSKAINRQVAIVDHDGVVREGILDEVADDQISVRFGSGTRIFSREGVASAERVRDGRTDGFVKGAVFGAVAGLLVMGASESGSDRGAAFVMSTIFYGGIGYALDAVQTNREPIYRAPAPAPTASLKLSLRF